MNVYERISAVMQDISYLTKDDSVETGGGKSYRAITEEKVTSAVRAALIKHGLVILPISQTRERTDERVTAYDKYRKCDVEKINRVVSVDVKYRIQNVNEPDDYVEVMSSGEGVDTQDKGVGKAMTYSYKYMLLRTFAIPTGEDPDKISSDLYTEKLLGTKDIEDKKPNTKDIEDKKPKKPLPQIPEPNVYPDPEIIKQIYAIGEENGCDSAKMDAWVQKVYQNSLDRMDVPTLTEVLNKLKEAK